MLVHWLFVVVAGALAGALPFVVVDVLRDPVRSTRRRKEPSRCISSALTDVVVRQRVRAVAEVRGFKVVEAEDPRRLVLWTDGLFRSADPGWFFPVYLDAGEGAGMSLEVGVRRRMPAIRRALRPALADMVAALEQELARP